MTISLPRHRLLIGTAPTAAATALAAFVPACAVGDPLALVHEVVATLAAASHDPSTGRESNIHQGMTGASAWQ